jgi:RNA polymerase sigma-70 factor (ECF subfamily)
VTAVTLAGFGRYPDEVTAPTASELIALLRRRDPRGFDGAYAAYAGPLYGFLRRLSGRTELAEDLLQHVFLRLAERGPELRPDSDLRAWLFAVARNAYVSHLRRTPELADEAALEVLADPPPDVEARLLLGDVERALSLLRLEDREVLLLVGIEGLDRDSVGRLLGIQPAALRQRLARARSRLLAELERARTTPQNSRKTAP